MAIALIVRVNEILESLQIAKNIAFAKIGDRLI